MVRECFGPSALRIHKAQVLASNWSSAKVHSVHGMKLHKYEYVCTYKLLLQSRPRGASYDEDFALCSLLHLLAAVLVISDAHFNFSGLHRYVVPNRLISTCCNTSRYLAHSSHFHLAADHPPAVDAVTYMVIFLPA